MDDFEYLRPNGTLWSWPGQNPLRYGDPSGHDRAIDPLQWSPGVQAFFYDAGEAAPALLRGSLALATITGQAELVPIFRSGNIALEAIDAYFAVDKELSKYHVVQQSNGGSCPAKTVDDVLSDSTPGKASKPGMGSSQFEKPGGQSQADQDFDDLTGGASKDHGGGIRSGELPDGSTISVRPQSSQGSPTIQINPPDGSNPIKIRYTY